MRENFLNPLDYYALLSAISVLIVLFIIFLLAGNIIAMFQENIWDEYHVLRESIAPSDVSDELIVVEFDEKSYEAYGDTIELEKWRSVIFDISEHAELVAIDCGLGGEDVQQAPEITIIRRPENIIFPVFARGASVKEQIVTGTSWKPLCLDINRFPNFNYGHTVFVVDDDGVARKVPVFVQVGKDEKKALSIEAVRKIYPDKVTFITGAENSFMLLDGKSIPLEAGSSFRPQFHRYTDFKVISFVDIDRGKIPMSDFEGKIVLVGINLPGWGAQYLTPLNKKVLVPSIVVQANAFNALLTDEVYSITPTHYLPLIVLVVTLLFSFALSRANVGVSFFLVVFIILVYFAVSFLFFINYYLIDTIYTPTAMVLSFAFVHAFLHAEEAREKKLVEDVFSRYLKPEIVQNIVRDPHSAIEMLKGTTREATVLFADIRGFTRFSEDRDPKEVVAVLNKIFARVADVVFSEDGMIDKFIGDGVMALFNVPYDQDEHADRAVRCALKMVEAIKDEGLSFGIGINTGDVVVGNIGSPKRLEYTAIGDTVNTASRLCSAAKGSEILITEETKERLKGSYVIEEVGEQAFKGKTRKIKVFRVKGEL